MKILFRKIAFFIYIRSTAIDFEAFTTTRKCLIGWFLGQKLAGLQNLVVRSGVFFSSYKNLTLGKHVSINHNCFISSEGGLEIGDYVSIGHCTSIVTTEHTYNKNDTPIKYQDIIKKPVKINNNVWIGANVTILAGLTIPSGTIIAAGAVVTKSPTQQNTIVAGVPARFIKNRLDL